MSDENKKDFWEIVFDGVLENIGGELNKRIKDAIPRVFDWLQKNGAEKYSELKSTYRKIKMEQLSSPRYINQDNDVKLDSLLKKHESSVSNDAYAEHKELIEALSIEISENYSMWESFSLFIQEVDCPHCYEKVTENWFDYVHNESSSERNMGTETIYSIECDEYQCPKCGELFTVNGYIEAYPDGIYNHHDLKTSTI